MGLKAFSLSRDTIDSYLPRLSLSDRMIPHVDRLQSPSVLMERQISPLTMSYSTNEKMWYKKDKVASFERANFIMQRRHNTTIISKKG